MRKLIKKSQAMVELAILGPLVLVALGMLITYICKVNNDCYAIMQAFRGALAKSNTENKAVSFGTWHDPLMADATNPIVGKRTTSSGSAYAMWSICDAAENGQEDQKGSMWIKINYFPAYDISQAKGGGVEPRYLTWTSSTVNAGNNNGATYGSRSGGAGELMIYKIDKKYIFVQGRGHGR